jgi:hypothetical protein
MGTWEDKKSKNTEERKERKDRLRVDGCPERAQLAP